MNQDDYGNYNIQVLSQALKIYEVELNPIKQSEAEILLQNNLADLEAFIFNSTDHWFAIRKIDNIWFNLNSTNKEPGPQIISEFYLSAFLKGTEELGYTNFLVKNLPQIKSFEDPMFSNMQNGCKLVPIEKIVEKKVEKINMGDGNQEEMEKVMEQSKLEYMEKNFKDCDFNNEGKELLLI